MQSLSGFFQQQVSGLTISKEMQLLIQCRLLAATRKVCARLENGIVQTKSEISLLGKLSNRIDLLPVEMRRKIVEAAQRELSANSVALLREEAEKLHLFSEDKPKILDMLSEKAVRIFTPDKKYEPKTFGCLFFEYKAILYRLRERQAFICFKSIEPKGKDPFYILMQPPAPGEEFELLPEKKRPKDAPLVVFEGVVGRGLDRQGFAEKIQEIGFTKLILAAAAIEPPFERGSKMEDIKDTRAREEVLSYRDFAKAIFCSLEESDPMLLLDHVYSSRLQEEIGGRHE